VVKASSAATIAVPSIAGNPEGFLVQLLLSLPVVPDHVTLAPLQSLTADVVKEALLFVVVDLIVLALGNFPLLSNLDLLALNLHDGCLLLTVLLLTLDWGLTVNLGSAELVDNLLELVVGLLEVVVIIELKRVLLAWGGSAGLEASSSSSPHALTLNSRGSLSSSPHGSSATATSSMEAHGLSRRGA